MQKINFQNLPNTTTPVNATNLNQLQTNVENAINLKSDETDLERISTYSTSETTVGTWIDNKPIYRKCYTGIITLTTAGYFVFTDSNLQNIDTLIKYDYFVKDGTVFNPIPNNGDRITNAYIQASYGGVGLIVLDSNYYSNFEGKNYTIILEYTKTTD